MRAPPRRPEARLFDAQVLWRGAAQGSGLLAIVLVAYMLARDGSGSDEVARALAFTVLVLSSLALIQVNRAWAAPARWPRTRNAAFGWIASITVAMLAAVLWVPAIAGLFAFRAPSSTLLAIGAGLCLSAFAWFEGAKRLAVRYAR